MTFAASRVAHASAGLQPGGEFFIQIFVFDFPLSIFEFRISIFLPTL
jgi:hypothetical protein